MKVLKNLNWFFRENKKQYFIGIIGLLLTYIFIPIPSWIIGKVIDGIDQNTLSQNEVTFFAIILFVLIFLHYAASFIWQYFIFGNSMKIGRDSRRRLLSKLFIQSPPFYSLNSTGALMSKATYDIGNLQMIAGYGVLAFFEATVWPIVLIGIMAITINLKLTLISISILPLIIIFSSKVGKLMHDGFMILQEKFEKLNESVLENINSIRVIKGFSTQENTFNRFSDEADSIYNQQMKIAKLHALFFPIGRLIPTITFILAMIFGEKLIGVGELSLGQLVTFFMYLNMMVWPMFAFGDLINVYQESSSSIKRIQEVMDYKEDTIDDPGAIDYLGNKTIEFRNFNFTYPNDTKESLKDIDLIINPGETIGIVGKIGSGKTTLIKQFLRLYNVDKDTLLIDNISVENYKRSSIREKLGYVPQQHILFSKSVNENIAFGSRGASREEVMEAIRLADFEKDLHTLENGIETLVGEKGISISGGQKQRISIARAIIKDPEILILDDSLSAVDALTEQNIINNIREERKGKTTIIVAHRLSGIKHADKIIVLDEGKIVEKGTHEELVNNKQWYYQQYESQRLGGSDE